MATGSAHRGSSFRSPEAMDALVAGLAAVVGAVLITWGAALLLRGLWNRSELPRIRFREALYLLLLAMVLFAGRIPVVNASVRDTTAPKFASLPSRTMPRTYSAIGIRGSRELR